MCFSIFIIICSYVCVKGVLWTLTKKFADLEAAAEIGISMRGYQEMELGTLPRYEKLLRIADYYDVSVDWLMGRTENRYAHRS